MTAVVLAAYLLAAAPAKADATSAPRDDWDLSWMVATPASSLKSPTPPPDMPALRTLGRSLYESRCSGCHGKRGDGLGPNAAPLSIRPTNFSRGVYKLRSTPSGSIPTDGDLFITLTRGMHGTRMFPWTTLTERERWALVSHLKSFSVRFAEERPAPPIRVPAPPKENAALRTRGAGLYRQLMCARCHGEQGAGDGASARLYERTFNREVRTRDFTRGRFLRGAELEDIYLTLRTGIEGTPMAAYDMLRDDETWAVAAYVRALVRERPLQDLPAARTHAQAEHAHINPEATTTP